MAKTFIVKITEIHDQAFRVEAENEDEARQKVDADVAGENCSAIDSKMHYSHTLVRGDWPCFEEPK